MRNPPAIQSSSPDETFRFGEEFGRGLEGGELVLLFGGLGAGKTLLTKGILSALGYDVDEVTSPSFTLVNLYRTGRFDVYHIDLWRAGEGDGAAFDVGLDEIFEDETAVVIIEWAERLGDAAFDRKTFRLSIDGDGDEPRRIYLTKSEQNPAAFV